MKGSRKVLTFLFCVVVAAVLCWGGKMDGAQWVSFMTIAFPFFVAGNVGEHFRPKAPEPS